MLETIFWTVYLSVILTLLVCHWGYFHKTKDSFFGFKIGSILESSYIIKSSLNSNYLFRVIPRELDFTIDEIFVFVQPSDWTICGIVVYKFLSSEKDKIKFRSFIVNNFFKNFSKKEPCDMGNYLITFGKSLNCLLQETLDSTGVYVESVFIYSSSLMSLLEDEVKSIQNLVFDQERVVEIPNYIQ